MTFVTLILNESALADHTFSHSLYLHQIVTWLDVLSSKARCANTGIVYSLVCDKIDTMYQF